MLRMDLVHLLGGLDIRHWSSLCHAYGSAEDIPDLLRALTGADADAADEALSELTGAFCTRGRSTPPARAPTTARPGRSTGHGPGGRGGPALVATATVGLPGAGGPPDRGLGGVPHPRDRDRAPRTARAGTRSPNPPRAEVLAGIARLDPQSGAAAAAAVMDPSQPAEVRMAAVFASLDAGGPWTEPLHTTMLSLLPADPLRSDLDLERGEPLAAVIEALLGRGRRKERRVAFALIDAALHDGRTEVRAEGLWAADRACMLSRSAPRRLGWNLRSGGRRRGVGGGHVVPPGPAGRRRRTGRGHPRPLRRTEPGPRRRPCGPGPGRACARRAGEVGPAPGRRPRAAPAGPRRRRRVPQPGGLSLPVQRRTPRPTANSSTRSATALPGPRP